MWAETAETEPTIDTLSSTEKKSITGIIDGMGANPNRTTAIIDATLKDASSLAANENTKQVETQNYLANVIKTVTKITTMTPPIPYGKPNGYVCDEFVKVIVKKLEPKENHPIIDGIYGTRKMFDKIHPTKTLKFEGQKLVTVPPIGSVLFFVNKLCDHVGFFMGMKNGEPQIADANGAWVTQRKLRPNEAKKIYYEENYREKFIKQKAPKKKMI